jgi:hypothetical protein
MHCWLLIDVPGVLDKLIEKYRWVYFVFYFVVWLNSLPDFRQSKFGCYLAGGSIESSDFGTDVNNHVLLNYSVLTRQVLLRQCTISRGITKLLKHESHLTVFNHRGSVCITWHRGTFTDPFLSWKNSET